MLKLISRVLAFAIAAVVAGALFVTAMALWSWWAPTEPVSSECRVLPPPRRWIASTRRRLPARGLELCLSRRALVSLELDISAALGGGSTASRRVFGSLSPQRVALDRPVRLLGSDPIPFHGGDDLATRGRPTQQKRQKERARQEQRKIKDARRQEAKDRREAAPPPLPGVDRDLDGIIAGPQPLTEWQQEGLAAFEAAEEETDEEAADQNG